MKTAQPIIFFIGTMGAVALAHITTRVRMKMKKKQEGAIRNGFGDDDE